MILYTESVNRFKFNYALNDQMLLLSLIYRYSETGWFTAGVSNFEVPAGHNYPQV